MAEDAKEMRARLCDPAQQTKIVFVDSDGSEYPGTMLPVPTNKGTLFDVPLVTNFQDEVNKIQLLPREKQVAAFAELNGKMSKTAKAISLNNRTHDLYDWNGILCWVTQDANGVNVPCADLMVNVSKKEDVIEMKHRSRVMPLEFVGVAAKGQKQRQHFRLA